MTPVLLIAARESSVGAGQDAAHKPSRMGRLIRKQFAGFVVTCGSSLLRGPVVVASALIPLRNNGHVLFFVRFTLQADALLQQRRFVLRMCHTPCRLTRGCWFVACWFSSWVSLFVAVSLLVRVARWDCEIDCALFVATTAAFPTGCRYQSHRVGGQGHVRGSQLMMKNQAERMKGRTTSEPIDRLRSLCLISACFRPLLPASACG